MDKNQQNNSGDIIKQQYNCLRCGDILFEKKPKDKYIVRNKNNTVRLSCKCGYYKDIVVEDKDFN